MNKYKIKYVYNNKDCEYTELESKDFGQALELFKQLANLTDMKIKIQSIEEITGDK